jgi:hypothetical protein
LRRLDAKLDLDDRALVTDRELDGLRTPRPGARFAHGETARSVRLAAEFQIRAADLHQHALNRNVHHRAFRLHAEYEIGVTSILEQLARDAAQTRLVHQLMGQGRDRVDHDRPNRRMFGKDGAHQSLATGARQARGGGGLELQEDELLAPKRLFEIESKRLRLSDQQRRWLPTDKRDDVLRRESRCGQLEAQDRPPCPSRPREDEGEARR